ncbi:MAG: T9SS type A sorting domain-containing protein [Cytophagaceae bacterium]|jgi:hypothetical protein|nr:T9SS type A sorting domain-containing protein [Cytophagaceae bacterium]
MKKIFLLFLLAPSVLLSQNEALRMGEWRHHFSFRDCFAIIETNEGNIVGATRMGLVEYDQNNQTLTAITKFDGLSDYELSALSYSPQINTIFVGYENGNIDIVANGTVLNINDLKLNPRSGSKRIRHILFDDSAPNIIYCSTSFGVLMVDIKKREIVTTWYIGNNATDVVVHQLAKHEGHFYAATEQGIKRIPLALDPAFFSNWQTISNSDAYCALEWFNGNLVAIKGSPFNNCQLQQYRNGLFTDIATIYGFVNLSAGVSNANQNRLIVTAQTYIAIYNEQLVRESNINSSHRLVEGENTVAFSPQFNAGMMSSGNLWIADEKEGILRCESVADALFMQYLPQGPVSNKCWKILFAGGNLFAVQGGKDAIGQSSKDMAAVSIFTPKGWELYTSRNIPEFSGHSALLGITSNPSKPDNIFLNSWGGGVFILDRNEQGKWYATKHLPKSEYLKPALDLNGYYVKIGGMAYDAASSLLYIPNMEVSDCGLVGYFPDDGTYKKYTYETLRGVHTTGMIMTHSKSGDRWINIESPGASPHSKGIFVWNDNGTPKNENDDVYKGGAIPSQENDKRNAGQLLLIDDEGNTVTNSVFSLAEDQSGYVWIGTDMGVLTQFGAEKILTTDNPRFTRVKVPHNDGTNDAGYLLENEKVTVIVVDGGNRKWFGTEANGIYLVSPDGANMISHFDMSNSLLPSNEIKSIAIDDKSGEVFVGTPRGIVSFRGTATQGAADFKDVYVFPNPVRPEYTGTITVAGLMTKSSVKITDISGKLVFETTSAGGTAQWDGCNFWGERVKSGVYLIFVSAQDGSLQENVKSEVIKLAIVR